MKSARELVTDFRHRTKTPMSVLEETLSRLPAWQSKTSLFVSTHVREARAEAEASGERYRRGTPQGPLDGILVGLKDLIDVKGVPTTAGSEWFLDRIAEASAPLVQHLLGAGANPFLGKLNLHEFAYGPTGDSSYFGPVRNPYNPDHMSGGSSGGSGVAVATGLMPVAIGTDSGGSVRIPAAFTGVSGMKPSYGLVSRQGVFPLAWSLDHVGPLARTVEDIEMTLSVLADKPIRAAAPSGRRPRLLWVEGSETDPYTAEMQDALAKAVDALARSVNAEVVRGPLPELPAIWSAQSLIMGAEALNIHWQMVTTHPERYQPDVRARLVDGGGALAVEYLQARRFQRAMKDHYDRFMEGIDAICLATVPITAPKLGVESIRTPRGGDEPVRATVTRLTSPFNFLGLPALSVPCGRSSEGLPFGLQVVGGRDKDAMVLWLGKAFQAATEHHHLAPPGAL